MTVDQRFVIVGAGLAGAKAAQALRAEGFTGSITLCGDETDNPYVRPPLSKDYLQGTSQRDSIDVHPPGWYAEHDVDLLLGSPVTAIDRSRHEVLLADGPPLRYDKLLVATGSAARRLPVPGADLAGVLTLRRVADSDAIRGRLGAASRVVVIGAGWIGLEVAAAARLAGLDVAVLEAAQLPLLAVLGRETAQVFAELHRRHGVDLHLGVGVSEITGAGGRATGVQLVDGSHVEADFVVEGVGASPNTELARTGRARRRQWASRSTQHLRTSRPGHLRGGRRGERVPSVPSDGTFASSTGPTR